MSVTVGIPTTGVRPVLRRCVEAAVRSATAAGQDAEVLVVLNGRADAPGLGRVNSPLLRVVRLDQPNVSAARNRAIALARHNVVLFADDDVLVPRQWCAQLRAALRAEPATDRSRRYTELIWPVARDAFRIYAAISKFCYLAGVLHAVGASQGRPVISLDQARLTAALRHAAGLAAARVAGLTAADWRGMPVDYSSASSASLT